MIDALKIALVVTSACLFAGCVVSLAADRLIGLRPERVPVIIDMLRHFALGVVTLMVSGFVWEMFLTP